MNRICRIVCAVSTAVVAFGMTSCGGGGGVGGNGSVTPPTTGTGSTGNPMTVYCADFVSIRAYYWGQQSLLPKDSLEVATTVIHPQAALVSPDGNTLVVTNPSGTKVVAYRIDKSTGALTPAPGSPFASGGGGLPKSIAFAPDSRYLYLARTTDADRLDVFAVSPSTSELSLLAAPAVPGFSNTRGVAVDPSGSHVYVYGDGLAVYQNNGGSLVPVAGSPFLTNRSFLSVAVHPSGNYFAASDGGYVRVYQLTSGIPGPELQGSPFPISEGTLTEIAFRPDGVRAFGSISVPDPTRPYYPPVPRGNLVVWTLDVANGEATLTQLGSRPTEHASSQLTFDSMGQNLLVIEGPDPNSPVTAGPVNDYLTNPNLTPRSGFASCYAIAATR